MTFFETVIQLLDWGKMFKFLGCLLKIFLSFLIFFAIGIFSVLVTPYITAEHYGDNETPHIQFRVLVKNIDNVNKKTNLHAVKWSEYSEDINDYEAYRSPAEGRCNDCPLWCRAKNISPGKQLIELRYYQENFRLYNKYYVTNEEIIPLYLRIMDRGTAMFGFLVSLIMTPIAVLCFGFFWKRFKNVTDKSNGTLPADR